MKKTRWYIIFIFFLAVSMSACSTVKPYQRAYLNDPEMQLDSRAGLSFEHYVFSIRTGSTVAGSKKASGGCGCN